MSWTSLDPVNLSSRPAQREGVSRPLVLGRLASAQGLRDRFAAGPVGFADSAIFANGLWEAE